MVGLVFHADAEGSSGMGAANSFSTRVNLPRAIPNRSEECTVQPVTDDREASLRRGGALPLFFPPASKPAAGAGLERARGAENRVR